MLKHLSAHDFKAVAHLETSPLMEAHGGKVRFSTKKPNVLVGPNGTGKTALLDTIALRFLATLTGVSTLDDNYVKGSDSDHWFSAVGNSWRHEYEFLQGLTVETDNGPVAYYRPHHIPGNERDLTVSLMCGYSNEARAFDALTRNKSSGQMCQALLTRLLAALSGESLPTSYVQRDWRYGIEPRSRDDLYGQRGYTGPWEFQAELLKAMFGKVEGSVPLVLMDEPEQSLDVEAQLKLWRAIEAADCSKMQVIVATHSLYPLLRPKAFNIIETQPGYVKKVQSLLDLAA